MSEIFEDPERLRQCAAELRKIAEGSPLVRDDLLSLAAEYDDLAQKAAAERRKKPS